MGEGAKRTRIIVGRFKDSLLAPNQDEAGCIPGGWFRGAGRKLWRMDEKFDKPEFDPEFPFVHPAMYQYSRDEQADGRNQSPLPQAAFLGRIVCRRFSSAWR